MKQLQHKVSVILPTYNRAELLGRAIRSVLMQTHADLELIVIDDFSTDNTQSIVHYYSQIDSRIKPLLNSRNLGLAKTRNRGLAVAQGEYLATLDDDDEWIDSDKLFKQVNIYKMAGAEIGIVATGIQQHTSQNKFKPRLLASNNIFGDLLIGNSLIYTSTALFPSSLVKSLNGFDEKMPKGIDSDLYRRIIINKRKKVIILADITVAVHEYGSDRITNSKTKKQKRDNIIAHTLVLLKFWYIFVINPRALVYRLYCITKNLLRL